MIRWSWRCVEQLYGPAGIAINKVKQETKKIKVNPTLSSPPRPLISCLYQYQPTSLTAHLISPHQHLFGFFFCVSPRIFYCQICFKKSNLRPSSNNNKLQAHRFFSWFNLSRCNNIAVRRDALV